MTTAQSLAASVQQYQKTYDKAIEFYSLFEDADAPELLRMQSIRPANPILHLA